MGTRRFLKERWADACARAEKALEELQGLQQEFQEWDESLGNLRQAGWNIFFDEVRYLDFNKPLELLHKAKDLTLPAAYKGASKYMFSFSR